MKDQIIAAVKSLDLPKGEYCVFGGSSLAIRNIRPTNDIDIYVTQKLYDQLKQQGWSEQNQPGKMSWLTNQANGLEFEAFVKANPGGWQPKIKDYIVNPEVIDGIPFMPLKELYEWKKNTRRPKDLKDLKLIDDYWAQAKIL